MVAIYQLQLGAQCPDAIELDRGREAGRHDGDVELPAAARPGQGLAQVARAGAHHGVLSVVRELARDEFGAAALEAADRVRRFELDAHRAPERGLQRLAAVQGSAEKDGVDYPASRLDPSGIEARLRPPPAPALAMRAGSGMARCI
jgi:hypothetical protein